MNVIDDIPLSVLFLLLAVTILLSAFFSGSETSMMALDRHRLRHQAREQHRAARRVLRLLQRPDRLIGLILLGNNLVNIIAATLATLIGLRLLGDLGVALAPFILVAVFLIFAEVIPKTLAALYPESLAFPCSLILSALMKLLQPVVYVINLTANGILALCDVRTEKTDEQGLSSDELRSIVLESSHMIPARHRKMLLAILDLENIRVQDIMVPRSEITAINILDDSRRIMEQIDAGGHGRLPVYEGNIDNTLGILKVRRLPEALQTSRQLDGEALRELLSKPHFVMEGVSLYAQLQQFQKKRHHFGMVVDEYGVVQGIITLEDILEEIVGEFTTDLQDYSRDIRDLGEGSWLCNGLVTVREVNRRLQWQLPTDGPRTLNGLVLERLETIPQAGISLRLGEYIAEIVQVSDNAVKKIRITPQDNQGGPGGPGGPGALGKQQETRALE